MTLEEEKILQECARELLGEKAIKLMEHCIGYDPGRVYWRHGKKYYKPWRNHFCAGGSDLEVWDGLKKQGFAESGAANKVNFWLNNAGLSILSAAERVYIYNDAASGNEVDASPEVIRVLLDHAVFCGYGNWIPPGSEGIAKAARLPLKLTRETLKYLRDERGYVKHIYDGGADDEGFPYCTHGWILSEKWIEEHQERYKAAQLAEYGRMKQVGYNVEKEMEKQREGAII
ncbi:hypothetical protein IKF15_00625 [Candidatus Saccharibacteria bacterium]|nr:hypothetical protein [Candidatus Saccharibacteria bacterium]